MGFLLSAGAPVQRNQSPNGYQETHFQHESYRLWDGTSPLKMFKNGFNVDIESQFINVLLLAWCSTRPQELIRSKLMIIH